VDKVRVLHRAIRELLPITGKVLSAVVETQLDDDRASMRPALNCSRAVLWSWLGARTTRSKEPLRRSAVRSGFFLGLASGHSLWISCV
jgi:hypothetical protein